MKKNTPKQKKVPERRCTGCGGTFPKRDLVRVVRSPEGEVSLAADSVILAGDDTSERYPLSLGAWIAAEGTDAACRAAICYGRLILHTCAILTPFERISELSFTEHGIEIKTRRNVGFGGRDPQTILGYRL